MRLPFLAVGDASAWRAGTDPDGLTESLTGVYTGISNDEYRMPAVHRGVLPRRR